MTYRPGTIPEPRGDLNQWARELTHALRIELLVISKQGSFVGTTNAPGVSGYGNKTAITTSGTVVKLKSPLAEYIILYRCENSSGDGVGVSFTNINSNDFTATPLENATLHWTPIEIR